MMMLIVNHIRSFTPKDAQACLRLQCIEQGLKNHFSHQLKVGRRVTNSGFGSCGEEYFNLVEQPC